MTLRGLAAGRGPHVQWQWRHSRPERSPCPRACPCRRSSRPSPQAKAATRPPRSDSPCLRPARPGGGRPGVFARRPRTSSKAAKALRAMRGRLREGTARIRGLPYRPPVRGRRRPAPPPPASTSPPTRPTDAASRGHERRRQGPGPGSPGVPRGPARAAGRPGGALAARSPSLRGSG